ncbi:anti-sigma-I factor RsgI6-like [Haliotis rubra]|uniref:anti-sigma-I factor RsgI6-like n=1 Tax=Haliotis rubra TaxID=36100 RepID=UPI001EE5DDC7|nr:anti-sigma-I factor RsgI6-like [Haliotis rubra]
MLTFSLVIVIFLCVTSHSYGNLLVNSDLEQGDFSNTNSGWFGRSCTTSLSSVSYTGSSSARVSNRQARWAGLAQYVSVEEQKRYFFSGYIQLLNTAAGKMTGEVSVTLNYRNTITGAKKYLHMSTVRFLQPNMWQRIGGDITILPGYDKYILYIQVSSPEVDYLLDTTSLTEIPSLPINFEAVANASIDASRKADINIVATSGRVEGVTVEIQQLTSEFGFGTAVSAERIVDSSYAAYQDFFYDNFEWATIENKLKWSQTEKNKDVLTYDDGVTAVNELVERGVKVRGHTVFWGVPDKDPVWVQSLQGDALIQAMMMRGKNVTSRTLGKLEHWDVNNENVHGNFYEEATGHVNITMDIFSEVRSMDPKPKLFLNDFAIVNSGRFTQAYRNQAKMFRAETPIYGVGIQSHLTPPLDLTLIKHRLDQIVEVGLPIWITEMDIDEPDQYKKADLLEDVLRLYFSTPAVQGVTLWGFWDGKIWKTDAALANGPTVTPNAAGLRWQQLVKQDWRTYETHSLAERRVRTRGFKGNYSLRVKKDGTVVEEQQFTLGSCGADISLNL